MASSSSDRPSKESEKDLDVDGLKEMTLTVKWSEKEYTVRIFGDDTVYELKRRICEVTTVLPKRQKLLYPNLSAKLGGRFDPFVPTLAESLRQDDNDREEDVIDDQEDSPEVVDDFGTGQEEVVDIKDKESNKLKLKRRIDQYQIKLLNPCREGKKLLVLDIDYTLLDHRSTAENPRELMRPHLLHEFLGIAYTEYDIIIWSATSMNWIELQMGELGVLTNPKYKITALLDHLAMITVQSDTLGTFDCKPLGLIWAQLPEYNSTNIIMLDDVRRNFAMNPQNGLTVRPFRKAHANRSTDIELGYLTAYLSFIAELDDLSVLDHRRWESIISGDVIFTKILK